jgi:hypothetical protein
VGLDFIVAFGIGVTLGVDFRGPLLGVDSEEGLGGTAGPIYVYIFKYFNILVIYKYKFIYL